jgi:hypothetical protein
MEDGHVLDVILFWPARETSFFSSLGLSVLNSSVVTNTTAEDRVAGGPKIYSSLAVRAYNPDCLASKVNTGT